MAWNDCYETPRWLANELVEQYAITIDAQRSLEALLKSFCPEHGQIAASESCECVLWNPPFEGVTNNERS